ncbi:putative LRR receptor-like serine/threonine-protein kinase [Prunus yedoensis var. nudiflora]|uniref:Putative LRR receptor-like serine/threonine-protein kinase n=1 Tax=Prunus yedoensis var. nudiflora TaxID=2094558 RepID=A0A314XVG8_PRUYE|nr:putative LRR receptor-like serine/threonine-protein kinase [Prunus yedoensis var. nudiflora]
MFTGKRAMDDMFRDGLSIHQFTNAALPDHASDAANPSLLLERDDAEGNDDRHGGDMQERPSTRNRDRHPIQERRLEKCLVSVMKIGLSCL